MRFVDENRDSPFFLYLATNAPHSPYLVAEEWAAPYRESVKWQFGAEFYGMIANFDHNVGLLRDRLDALGLADDTIFIFMTDNGTSKGNGGKGLSPEDAFRGFNAGMRGQKSTVFEGGHRVPFFIHWPNGPNGGLVGGRDAIHLAAHLDVLPTLAELCGIDLPEGLKKVEDRDAERCDGREPDAAQAPALNRDAVAGRRQLAEPLHDVDALGLAKQGERRPALARDRDAPGGGEGLGDVVGGEELQRPLVHVVGRRAQGEDDADADDRDACGERELARKNLCPQSHG